MSSSVSVSSSYRLLCDPAVDKLYNNYRKKKGERNKCSNNLFEEMYMSVENIKEKICAVMVLIKKFEDS